jgi:hypothetical protein
MARLKVMFTSTAAALAVLAALAGLATSRVVAQQAPSAPPAAQGVQGDRSDNTAQRSERWWRQGRDRNLEDDHRSFEDYAGDVVDDGPRWTGPGPADRRDGYERRGDGPSAAPRFGGPLCGPAGERVVARMLDRLESITRPTEAQRPAFEKLAEAAAKAREIAREGCPTERPVTPPGRLAAAEKRLDALLQAIRAVRPAMDEYYASLNEEQKARLYIATVRPGWGDRFEGGRDRLDRPRERLREDFERPRRDQSREDWREERDRSRGLRERDRDDDRRGRGGRGRDRGDDDDRDGWPDSWRGRS